MLLCDTQSHYLKNINFVDDIECSHSLKHRLNYYCSSVLWKCSQAFVFVSNTTNETEGINSAALVQAALAT